MKKMNVIILVFLSILFVGGIGKMCIDAYKEEMQSEYENKEWFLIENIEYDEIQRKISGNCIEGPYLGEVEIYLPPFTDASGLKDGVHIKALCGPGMTMSLPPQLMGCTKIVIIE